MGSIAQLDRRYSIILEAINSQTGETIAGALAEAEGKDQVLRAFGQAATQLRGRLGESLASIQKFDAPPEQATTASLEALKAWSRGVDNVRSGKGSAMALYRRLPIGSELRQSPRLALARLQLSEQPELAAEHAAKAFALKGRVTEREKFDIASNYYATRMATCSRRLKRWSCGGRPTRATRVRETGWLRTTAWLADSTSHWRPPAKPTKSTPEPTCLTSASEPCSRN